MKGFWEVWQDKYKRYFIRTYTKYTFNGDDKLIKKDILTYEEALIFMHTLIKLKGELL